MAFFSKSISITFFLASLIFLNVNLFGQNDQYYQNNYSPYQTRENASSANLRSDYQQNYNGQNYYQANQQYSNDYNQSRSSNYPYDRGYSQGYSQQYVNDQPATRHGDWEYHNNWRYYKHAYLSGENHAQYYRRTHPYGQPGIGYDADEDYLNMKRDISQRGSIKDEKNKR